jgi:hypothetical protein
MIGRIARFLLAGAMVAWLADWWLGEHRAELRARGLMGPMRTSTLVRGPIERVWDELVDIPGQLRWMGEMKAVTVDTRGPLGIGTRAHATVRVFGVAMPDPVEITEWQPPERYGFRHLGPWRGEGLITLKAAGEDLTRVDWEEVLVAPMLPHLGDVLHHLVLGPIFRDDLETFRSLVESGPAR